MDLASVGPRPVRAAKARAIAAAAAAAAEAASDTSESAAASSVEGAAAWGAGCDDDADDDDDEFVAEDEAESVGPKRGGGGAGKAGTTSRYRGVTKHKRSGRWEAHIWVKDTGKQVYLGGFELEEHAAEAFDVAAIKSKGQKAAQTNFGVEKYADLVEYLDGVSMDELTMAIRRQSQGFSRGSSTFRGVTRHPNGRWESRIGMPGSKHIYLGLFEQEPAAAKSYDRALVRLRGTTAATNFSLGEYQGELRAHQLDRLGQDLVMALGAGDEGEEKPAVGLGRPSRAKGAAKRPRKA